MVNYKEDSLCDLVGEINMYRENLVSIIIPVYKVEKYLDKCIRSVVDQSYKNLEIIIVDDGSPDCSGMIAEKWAQIDGRINVIHQGNRGLSAARNTGLDNCHGKWIAFIDSDDYICPNYVEKMLASAIHNNVDLVISQYYEVTPDNRALSIVHNKCGIYNFKSFWNLYYSGDRCNTTALTVVWNKLYYKKIFKNLRFKEGIIHEDEQILYKIIKNARNILIIPDTLYYYRINRVDSIISSNGNVISSYSTIIEKRTQAFIEAQLFNVASKCNSSLFFVAIYDYALNSSDGNRRDFYLVLKEVKRNITFLKKHGSKARFKLRLYVKFPKITYAIRKIMILMRQKMR